MEDRIFGYARVSSQGQNLDRQIADLEKYVRRDNIITDKVSGKNLERPGYQALKGPLGLRKGDTLYVKSLDRLSRSKEDIKNELQWFQEQGVRMIVLDLPTTMVQVPEGQTWIIDMINNILIEVLASIAEQERVTIRQRQREGIEEAKRQGKHLRRPRIEYPENWEEYYLKWKERKISAVKAMQAMKLKHSSFYKMVKRYENDSHQK